ncbi:MAG: hypothetical protein LBB16_03735 [Puniceicoccales bacterium]|jgi:transcription initiation factor IIE alpha subunit|nr:hypothetical protein [Puniceicoccales bacterium]
MKKKNGSILLFVLTSMGILGALLIVFLGETTPKNAFYNRAVQSYGFLDKDKDQKLHGLLELETESVKNLTLANIKNLKELVFVFAPRIWNEAKLLQTMTILNKFNGNYWGQEDAQAVKAIWDITADANTRYLYDQTRFMCENASSISNTLQNWVFDKDREQEIVDKILKFSTQLNQRPGINNFDGMKKMLKDIIGQLNGVSTQQNRLDEKGWILPEHKSKEIIEIQRTLSSVLGEKYEQWQNDIKSVQDEIANQENLIGVIQKLKPPQNERFQELILLQKIEQQIEGILAQGVKDETSIDRATWQEIEKLLAVEANLPGNQDPDKDDFLRELEKKRKDSTSWFGRPKYSESDLKYIRDGLLKTLQNSMVDALNTDSTSTPEENALLQQMAENTANSDQNQSEFWSIFSRHLSELFSAADLKTSLESWQKESMEKSSKALEDVLNSINKDLFDEIHRLATDYNNRVSNNDYQALKSLARTGFNEALTENNAKDRLQSIYFANLSPTSNFDNYWVHNINSYVDGRNYNIVSDVSVDMLDNKIPLTPKFRKEVEEVIRLTFRAYGISEETIKPFLDDIAKIITALSIEGNTKMPEKELEYCHMIIRDLWDTKRTFDVNVFKEFFSWQNIFRDQQIEGIESNILFNLGSRLTFAKDIDRIDFYAADNSVRQAILHVLPLRSEISNQQKTKAGLPTSGNMETIRQTLAGIFRFGLTYGNNNTNELQANNEQIQEILQLLYESGIVNFPETDDGRIDVFSSYGRAIKVAVSVWDKDYKPSLFRTTNYACKIDYGGNGKKAKGHNTVQMVEEF